jgi:serine/threonine protein kinase
VGPGTIVALADGVAANASTPSPTNRPPVRHPHTIARPPGRPGPGAATPPQLFDRWPTTELPRMPRRQHRAATVQYPAAPGAGDRVGPYRLLELIARGGTAEIHRAYDPARAEIVALKRVRRDGPELFRAMLRTEASLLEAMNHPNVIRVIDFAAAHRADYFTMDYVDGANLGTLMRAMGRRGVALPMNVCVAIAAEIAAGLHHAHQLQLAPGIPAGIVHRDVCAWNILVGFDGSVKLADFGVSRIDLHEPRETTLIAGRPGYMSPEQLRGDRLDRRSDIFSLGVLLWEMTTGQTLFGGDTDDERTFNTLQGMAPRPSAVFADYPREVERVVMRALAPSPARRYPTARAMLIDLLDCQCASPTRARSMIAAAMHELLGRQRTR